MGVTGRVGAFSAGKEGDLVAVCGEVGVAGQEQPEGVVDEDAEVAAVGSHKGARRGEYRPMVGESVE